MYPELGLFVNLEVYPGRNRSSASMQSCQLLLTGWFAVNSDVVDYHPPPKAVFATSQMFLIQGFEANPSYTL